MRAHTYTITIWCGQTSMATGRPTLQSALAEAFRAASYYADPNVANGRPVSAEVSEDCARCEGTGTVSRNKGRGYSVANCPDCKGESRNAVLRFACELHSNTHDSLSQLAALSRQGSAGPLGGPETGWGIG